MTGFPWSPKDISKDRDKGAVVFLAGQRLRTVTGQDAGLNKDTSAGKAAQEEPFPDGDLDPRMAEAVSPKKTEAPEEQQIPRTRPREGEEPLDLFSRLPVRRRITRNFDVGSPKREATETELLEIEESRSKVLRVSSVASHGTA